MANRGREYAEALIGALDRSAYNQQRDVAQNTYNTNWQNVQNQYRNLQDKLKLQQERANRDFAEGLVDVAEDSFNRQRTGNENLSNRGLLVSGMTNMLNQADTMQKGDEIAKLLKNAGDVSSSTADKLSQATSKAAQEGSGLMGKFTDTLADIGDAETAAQNQYNQVLAGIAGAMDEREAQNALSSSKSSVDDELEEFYKRAAISEVLSNSDMTDQQKQNYLGIIFGKDNAGKAVEAYNTNINATDNYSEELKRLRKAADKEAKVNQDLINKVNRNEYNKRLNEMFNANRPGIGNIGTVKQNDIKFAPVIENLGYATASRANGDALRNLIDKGITYEDLAAILYGTR